MRRLVIFTIVTAILGFTSFVDATLWDRGNGMIYDDALNVTWLQDVTYARTSGYDSDGLMTWDNAMAWADQLIYGGYDDWRLPIITEQVITTSPTSGEMAYMYYVNLGNVAYGQSGWTDPLNVSFTDGNGDNVSFINLYAGDHWSSTEKDSNLIAAWAFGFRLGYTDDLAKWDLEKAWAVRDGDVTDTRKIPEPTSILLLGLSMLALAGSRKKSQTGGI